MSHEESSVKLGSGGSFKNSSIHFDSMEDGQISSDFSELPVDPKETINNINLLSNKKHKTIFKNTNAQVYNETQQ
jgi:hypothetical protein